MKKLNTFGRYLKKKFKTKVTKIPLGISGFTCPNIDGKVAKGGCVFCQNDSFSPNIAQNQDKFFLNMDTKINPILNNQLKELENQILRTREYQRINYGSKKFIVYFQSYTNTYAPFKTLKTLFDKALTYDDIIGLSIGTRSDSISDETLEYLSELNKDYEIWIEYGIQSIYDSTLKRINRGHNAKNIKEAIIKTKKMGLNVCGHLIFGLPDETQEMMIQSAKISYEWGIDSIKYHPLYIVKNTLLANDYKNGKFIPISKELYIDTLIKAIKLKPDNISIQRVTAGTNDNTLLAPKWCGIGRNKMQLFINNALREAGLEY